MMNFDIPMKTTGALNSQTLRQQSERIKPAIDLRHATNQDFAVNRSRSQSRNTVNLGNSASRYSQPLNASNSGNFADRYAQPVPVSSSSGTYLRKGQKISITEPFVRIGLGWDVLNPACELDASSFMLGQNERVLSDDWFIFYGQPQSPDRTIQYQMNQDRNSLDKVLIDVEISRIRPEVRKIVFAVTIYEAMQRRLNFSMTQNVYGRILNRNQQEIARFDLTDCSAQVTAMVIGELYRYKDTWKFNAIGSGVGRDLPAFCAMYGVNLE
ncbi:MAG: TerD family protein [Oscillospiraceae bacterium]|nr:TerD family protein [Oscillospiraceae bacterium]